MPQPLFPIQLLPSRRPSKPGWELSCGCTEGFREAAALQTDLFTSVLLPASEQSLSPFFTNCLSDINKANVCMWVGGEKGHKSRATILPFSLLSGFLRVFYSLFLHIKGDKI